MWKYVLFVRLQMFSLTLYVNVCMCMLLSFVFCVCALMAYSVIQYVFVCV